MEQRINEFHPQAEMTAEAAKQLSPLSLAFIGDTAYETALRTMILQECDRTPKDLQKLSSRYAKAETQAVMAERLLDHFNEAEAEIYQRGRNSKSHTVPKHASVAEYRAATGLEAVFGFLYLSGQTERFYELIREGMAAVHEEGI